MEKYFNFSEREKEIYLKWEASEIFKFDEKDEKPVFNICMPPPNANGELHLGHSLGYVVMDILGRFHRMMGKRVLLLPGKDHAGIQTQVVFESLLTKKGIDVTKMKREDFYKQCYEFCLDRSNYMRAQEKTLGLTADWEKEIFTLDPRLNTIVYQTFSDMWKDGLIYKGKRMIHWSVFSQTAISDIEVDYREENGHFWHIAYPLKSKNTLPSKSKFDFEKLALKLVFQNNSEVYVFSNTSNELPIGSILFNIPINQKEWIVNSRLEYNSKSEWDEDSKSISLKLKEEFSDLEYPLKVYRLLENIDVSQNVIVATTRPETMLGDSAVAVHPLDIRYKTIVGKKIILPIQNREIPIISDERVTMGFGTGAVKITPAHDFLDFEIGETHDLEKIQVINQFGKMTKAAGVDYEGLSSIECRKKLVNDLGENFIIKVEKIKHKVPISERGKDIIEPLISEQWFLNVDKEGNSLKKKALKFIEEGKINIYPPRLKAMFVQWLTKLKDWNISRQIIWGHQMPVWYNKDEDSIHIGSNAPNNGNWEREEDTFDTWFSSGQWSFSTLAANNLLDINSIEKSKLFPNHTMVMGKDILFFWACRMLLFATYRFQTIPWKNIYFTGLILDKDGKKMSKSKGNGIEPLELIEKYGTDALRLGLISGSTPGNDTRISENKIKGSSNFINKIWNAAKFVNLQLKGFKPEADFDFNTLQNHFSKWILEELSKTKNSVTNKINNYDLSLAMQELYSFTWTIFCDWYLEFYKVQKQNPNIIHHESIVILQVVTAQLITMLHPFIPFVTEEIYNKVPALKNDSFFLANSPWEKMPKIQSTNSSETKIVLKIITSIRSIKSFLKIEARNITNISLNINLSEESIFFIEKMAQVNFISRDEIENQSFILKPTSKAIIYFATNKKSIYKKVLENEMEQLRRLIQKDNLKLNNAKFIKNAPEEIVKKIKTYHDDNVKNLTILKNEIEINK